jgi:hypothetical protein
MQITGHKNVASIINYSTLSKERHKKISNIFSKTETNRNALVPVVSNLPRRPLVPHYLPQQAAICPGLLS